MRQLAVLLAILLAACTTGERMGSVSYGMTREQVIAVLGPPSGGQRSGNTEAITYVNRLISGWSWDRADYHVILTDGQVTAYGPGVVRQNPGPAFGTMMIVPIR